MLAVIECWSCLGHVCSFHSPARLPGRFDEHR
jgi:hypothetical protein